MENQIHKEVIGPIQTNQQNTMSILATSEMQIYRYTYHTSMKYQNLLPGTLVRAYVKELDHSNYIVEAIDILRKPFDEP